MTHDENKLPRWAQERLADLRHQVFLANEARERALIAHAATVGKDWFTLPGPPQAAVFPNDSYHLFYLSHSGAHPVCTLYKGDSLLIGRKERP